MTRTTFLVCVLVFAVVFAAHVGYHAWREAAVDSRWVALHGVERPSVLVRYAERQDYYLGYSYALAGSFTAFALMLTVQQRRRQMGGVIGGLTIMGVLYGAGCFLLGCCGSPMLAVYVSLFGALFLGAVKPLVAGITTLSVLLSGVWVTRRARRPCCPPAAPSPQPDQSPFQSANR